MKIVFTEINHAYLNPEAEKHHKLLVFQRFKEFNQELFGLYRNKSQVRLLPICILLLLRGQPNRGSFEVSNRNLKLAF
jgi:hypothetical protein